jgi:protein SCO1/2
MPVFFKLAGRAVLLFVGLMLCFSGSQAAEQKTAHEILLAESQGINPRYLLAGPNGQAVSNEDFRGRFQLIAFGYTYCPDICPTTLTEMAEILRALGEQAAQVRPIFITLDPERDSAPVLKVYTAFFDPRIIGLTGSAELVNRTARNFKVRYAKVLPTAGDPKHYAVDHSAGLFLLGPDGQLIKKFAFGRSLDGIVSEIKQFIDQR